LQKLNKLETEKKALDEKLEDNSHIERQVEQLQQDLSVSDKEKNQTVTKLNRAEQHIRMLTATVDSLSADKERMAQLLRNETQNRSGTAAEIIQYKDQVDSLTHMLEALTHSKELVAQELAVQRAANCELQEDVRNLEIARKVVQNDMLGLQEEKKILQDQVVSAEKISEERAKQINDLQKEKECLLSELVQAASKRENEIRMMTEVFEGRLKDAANKVMLVEEELRVAKAEADERKKGATGTAEMNKRLTQQLLEAQNKISEQEHSLAEITREKESLEADLWKIVESRRKLIIHNEHLTNRLLDLGKESSPLNLQIQELSGELEKKTHFRKVFIDLEHRISNLAVAQEEATANKNVQLERLNAITERLSELDIEEGKLQHEHQEVATVHDQQEKELTETANKLTCLEERMRKYYLMEGGSYMCGDSEVDTLKAAVCELTVFVESSEMRISEIDQRMKEIKEEKSVLLQQWSYALERKNECKKCEEVVCQELIELQEQEREMVYGWGGPMPVVQGQLDHSLTPEESQPLTRQERAELRNKLEETGNLPEQQCGGLSASEVNVCLEKEQELKLRLQMAATEYRKLYTEKKKVEKRLAKLYHKLNEKKAKSSSSSEQSEASSSVVRGQPMTGELISLSQPAVSGSRNNTALPLQEKSVRNVSSVCPICNVEFPPGAFDLFRQHFDGHLS
jgi:chromosome segregation ATPase